MKSLLEFLSVLSLLAGLGMIIWCLFGLAALPDPERTPPEVYSAHLAKLIRSALIGVAIIAFNLAVSWQRKRMD